MARAISPTTRPRRSRVRPAPAPPPRPPSVSAPRRSDRAACTAGARPNSTPAPRAMAPVNPTTLRSRPISSTRGNHAGMMDTRPRIPHTVSTSPATPAMAARTRLSIRSWRLIRSRPAPSAERTAISRPRSAARASSRFATFAHAISRTNSTATLTMEVASRNSVSNRASSSRTRFTPTDWFVSG